MIESILTSVAFWVIFVMWTMVGVVIHENFHRLHYNRKQKAFVLLISGPAIWFFETLSFVVSAVKSGINAIIQKLK